MNNIKVSFFANLNETPISCVAYDKDLAPILNGRGGFGEPMRMIVLPERFTHPNGKFTSDVVLVSWLDLTYDTEVDKDFVIQHQPNLITYLRKRKINY